MKKTILFTLVFLSFAGISMAGVHHPRRKEVNSRLANQNARIDRKEAKGKMSPKEANKLHKEDHQIRQEEKRYGFSGSWTHYQTGTKNIKPAGK